jgi:hypothetical protein
VLYGNGEFAKHWLYWQCSVELFNSRNSAGNILQSKEYTTILACAVGVSIAVILKRCAVGLFLGKQTFSQYGDELARVMRKSLVVGKVSGAIVHRLLMGRQVYRSLLH